MSKRLLLKIHGTVQDVSFRAQARSMALSLGLSGYVKNLVDGTVEVVAEGDEVDLNKLLKWCHQGPKFAKVTKIENVWEDFSGNFSSFEIK